MLGLGNPIMGDDGVGIHVIRMVREKIPAKRNLEFKELGVGGIRLVEEMLGYKEVVIVDSLTTEDSKPGRIREFGPDELKESVQASPPHTTNFATALELYKKIRPDKIPSRIRIITVDVDPDLTFREGMSAPVQEAAIRLTDKLIAEIMG
jgi:hydrogenase maturation protease